MYIIINFLFVMPVVAMTVAAAVSGSMFAFFNSIDLAGYLSAAVVYYIYGLTYVHIVFCVVLFVLQIRRKDKTKLSVLAFSVIIADILVNVLWQFFGRFYSVQ